MRRSNAIARGRELHRTFPVPADSVVANGCFLAYVEKRGSFSPDFANEKPFFAVSFKKPQRAQRAQRKQLSVPSVSSVVNLLCHNPSTWKKLKSHADLLLTDHGGI